MLGVVPRGTPGRQTVNGSPTRTTMLSPPERRYFKVTVRVPKAVPLKEPRQRMHAAEKVNFTKTGQPSQQTSKQTRKCRNGEGGISIQNCYKSI